MTKDNQDDVDQVENALKYLKAGFQKGKKKSNVIKKKKNNQVFRASPGDESEVDGGKQNGRKSVRW